MTTASTAKQALQTFSVDVCRTGYGFATIEIEAQQQARDVAGDHYYSEKTSEYSLVCPVLSPIEQARADRAPMDLIFELNSKDFNGAPAEGVVLKFTDQLAQQLSVLADIVKQQGLSEARIPSPGEEFIGLRSGSAGPVGTEIIVARSWFCFSGHDEDSHIDTTSSGLDIETALKAFDAGASRFVVLVGVHREGDLSFLEDAGIFEDERGIDGVVVMDGLFEVPSEAVQAAYDAYRGVAQMPRE